MEFMGFLENKLPTILMCILKWFLLNLCFFVCLIIIIIIIIIIKSQ